VGARRKETNDSKPEKPKIRLYSLQYLIDAQTLRKKIERRAWPLSQLGGEILEDSKD